MISTQDASYSSRPRKLTRTYSLEVNGDRFLLTSLESPPPSVLGTVRTPPPRPPPEECNEVQAFSHMGASRLYMPCVPAPRGPRSTNLYLFPPTEADYAKARRWKILKAAAAEDARKEREDDERRRNVILGITVPRKSTRQVKSRSCAATEQEECTLEKSHTVIERRGRNGRRVPAKPTMSVLRPEPVTDDGSTSTLAPSISLISLPSPAHITRKPRWRPQSKCDSRPTPRLTTRGLTKAKANILEDEEHEADLISTAHSQIDALKPTNAGIENRDNPSSLASSRRFKTPAVHDTLNHTAAMSRLAPLELRSEDGDNRTSSSVDSSFLSSDTLCNESGMPFGLSKVILSPGVYVDTFSAYSKPPNVLTDISPMIRSASPTSGVMPLHKTSTMTNPVGENKRKSEIMDTDSSTPSQMQCRRSARVPKRRKLE